MADLQRTVLDILTNLFQDGQAADSISPQDMRDYVVSVAPGFFASNVTSASETTINTTDVFEDLTDSTYSLLDNNNWSMGTNGIFQYDGVQATKVHLTATMSISSASVNQQMRFAFAKNGSTITACETKNKISGSGDIQSMTVQIIADVVTNDNFRLQVANSTSTGNVTLEEACFNGIGIFS